MYYYEIIRNGLIICQKEYDIKTIQTIVAIKAFRLISKCLCRLIIIRKLVIKLVVDLTVYWTLTSANRSKTTIRLVVNLTVYWTLFRHN